MCHLPAFGVPAVLLCSVFCVPLGMSQYSVILHYGIFIFIFYNLFIRYGAKYVRVESFFCEPRAMFCSRMLGRHCAFWS